LEIRNTRAVDKDGNTIEFLLTANRDIPAVKRFFKKMMRADHRRLPLSISVERARFLSGCLFSLSARNSFTI
jgi:transposase-like protein